MNTVTLPAICDRTAARSIHPDLADAIGDTKVMVDASAVERIGQSMLQILVSASNTEGGITIATPSEPFMKAIGLAGLEASIGADIQEASAA